VKRAWLALGWLASSPWLALGWLAAAPGAQAADAAAVANFDVHYDVRLVPTEGVAHVAIRIDDPAREVRWLRFQTDPERQREFRGDGEITPSPTGDTLEWHPPKGGGTLRYVVRINHLRDEKSYDARGAPKWAIFRGDDLVPPVRLDTETKSESRSQLKLRLPQGWQAVTPYPRGLDGAFEVRHPHRRFDRPTGWMAVGHLAVLRERVANVQVTVAAPLDQRVRRLDLLALLRWTLPTLREITGGLPARLLVVGAGDPMWRGGLSGPDSVFIHASLPLISRDATSPLLHELMHAVLGISPGPGGDWIVEGLAESYSLELLVRSRTLSKKRHEKALAAIAERGRQAPTLEVERSSGATTARAVTVLHALDRLIRDSSSGARSLDDVVRILYQQGGEVTTERLKRIAEDLSGRELDAFFRKQLG
jgi:hypothetical protein